MKIFISADIEGVNGIVAWSETDADKSRYFQFQKQMTMEVAAACQGAKAAGADMVFVKDAHDSAMNLDVSLLPEYVHLHRGWEGSLCSMMAGLDKSFDAVAFIGYHSPAGSDGNSLSHTMDTTIHHLKINGVDASEFTINALYAAYLGVPVVFLSGDLNLTKQATSVIPSLVAVATKEGRHGAVVSAHPTVTNKAIEEQMKYALNQDFSKNNLPLPKHFHVEIGYKKHQDAYRLSFYPGCQLINPETIVFESDDYYEVLRAFKFIL
jgi:D-amino peptidase